MTATSEQERLLIGETWVPATAPWGGFKASGWGREFSHQALDAFTETKSIFVGPS